MTKEEAKEILSRPFNMKNVPQDILEAHRITIKALVQEPCDVFDEYGNYKYPSDVELTEPNTATSMPCEDAISRSDMLDAIGHGTTYTSEELQKIIKGLPSVNPQPKTGHWIDSPNGYFTQCSECGLHGAIGIYKHYGWCPKCGAKMAEPQERSDKE